MPDNHERTTRHQPPATTGERLLDYIRQYIAQHGYSPSYRDMVEGCAISSVSVVYHWMHKLRHEGLIDWVDGKNRTIRFIGDISETDLVIKLTPEQRQIIEEACGERDVAACAAATLVFMATHRGMLSPTNGHAVAQGPTRRGGPRA